MFHTSFRRIAPLVAVAAAAAFTSSSDAATLYYGGNPTGGGEGYNERSSIYNWDIFEFAGVGVPDNQRWSVTGLSVLNDNPGGGTPTQAHWEIRTGLTAGSSASAAGTIVASGDTPANFTNTSFTGLGTVQLLSVTLPSAMTFQPGQQFWFSVAPVGVSSTHQFFPIGADATAVGISPAVESFQMQSYINNVTGQPVVNFNSSARPSMSVLGSFTVVPEPATLSLLCGVAMTVLRRRK